MNRTTSFHDHEGPTRLLPVPDGYADWLTDGPSLRLGLIL
jgi:hypothetical protein